VLDITPSVSTFPEPRPEDGALVPTVAPAATVAVEQPRAFDRELKGFGRRLGRGGERQSIADMDF
jgi:hypothetical protein